MRVPVGVCLGVECHAWSNPFISGLVSYATPTTPLICRLEHVFFFLLLLLSVLCAQEATVADASIPDHKKADICRRIAETDRCLIDGCNEELQLLHLASVATRSCSTQQ